jgi:hypothetical protein
VIAWNFWLEPMANTNCISRLIINNYTIILTERQRGRLRHSRAGVRWVVRRIILGQKLAQQECHYGTQTQSEQREWVQFQVLQKSLMPLPSHCWKQEEKVDCVLAFVNDTTWIIQRETLACIYKLNPLLPDEKIRFPSFWNVNRSNPKYNFLFSFLC